MTHPLHSETDNLRAENERLRGFLGMLDLATATGDGLGPEETVRLNQEIHAALATTHPEGQSDG